MSQLNPAQEYVAVIRSRIEQYCNPDHPERFLALEAQQRLYNDVIFPAYNKAKDYLDPRIGWDATDEWLSRIDHRAKEFNSWSTADPSGRTVANQVAQLRYLKSVCDLPKLEREIMEKLRQCRRKGMPKKEAGVAVRTYLTDHRDATLREVAAAVGCSTGLVSETPSWKAVMEQRTKGRKPKAVALTPKLQASLGDNRQIERRGHHSEGRDQVLKKLISEQNADHEPSSVEGDRPNGSRRVINRREV